MQEGNTTQKTSSISANHKESTNEGLHHTPQQKGTTIRKNSNMFNVARNMLHAAKLESKFCEEAIPIAYYIQNRIYHHSLGFLTPFELWYGHKPHLHNLNILGCPTFAHISGSKKNKLDPKERHLLAIVTPMAIKPNTYMTQAQTHSSSVVVSSLVKINFFKNTTAIQHLQQS